MVLPTVRNYQSNRQTIKNVVLVRFDLGIWNFDMAQFNSAYKYHLFTAGYM